METRKTMKERKSGIQSRSFQMLREPINSGKLIPVREMPFSQIGEMNQPFSIWYFTIAGKFRVPQMRKIGMTDKPSDSSHEIIWERERMPPRTADFELDSQPTKRIPYQRCD